MSNKADAKPEAEAAASAESAPAKGGFLTKLPVLIGGVMVVEAVALFVVFKMVAGGPSDVDANLPLVDEAAEPELVEVAVDAFRAPNRLNGRTYLYDIEISVRVQAQNKERVEARLRASTGMVRDRMNEIIARIDPQKLNGAAEPGLETLRRQVKFRLDQIVGDGLIEEVLVPRCIPYRTDY